MSKIPSFDTDFKAWGNCPGVRTKAQAKATWCIREVKSIHEGRFEIRTLKNGDVRKRAYILSNQSEAQKLLRGVGGNGLAIGMNILPDEHEHVGETTWNLRQRVIRFGYTRQGSDEINYGLLYAVIVVDCNAPSRLRRFRSWASPARAWEQAQQFLREKRVASILDNLPCA